MGTTETKIRIRKPLIIVLVGCFVIIIFWVLAMSFSDSNSGGSNDSKKGLIYADDGKKVKPSKSIARLPDSYESDLLNRYRPEYTGDQEEIKSLKQRLQDLEQTIEQMRQAPEPAPATPVSVPVVVQPEPSKPKIQKPVLSHSGLISQVLLFQQPGESGEHESGQSGKKVKDHEPAKVSYPKTPYDLQAGASIPAVLQTKVISDLSGFIIGIVSKNIYDSVHGKYLVVPKGTKLIGAYTTNVNYGEKAISIGFNRLIRPDGSSIDLDKFPALSALGSSGIGEVLHNHWGGIIGAAFLSSVLSVPALLAGGGGGGGGGNCFYDKDDNYICNGGVSGDLARNAALGSMGQTASQLGNIIIQRALSTRPTVIVNPGFAFSVMVTKDLSLPPYKPG